MEGCHSIKIIINNNIKVQIGIQVGQQGVGPIEITNLIRVDELVELVLQDKSQLVIWDRVDREYQVV